MVRKRTRREIVRLIITLLDVEPRVARRMAAPMDTWLEDLHLYIQAATGWDNDPPWGFDARRHRQGGHRGPEDWDHHLDEPLLDVSAFLQGKRKFAYVYDYGARREHRIRFGRIQPARHDRRYTYLVSGTGRCPLEDIGGVWGHREFMRAFDDPTSQYRERFPHLCKDGATWDPEDVGLDACRSRLAPFTA